MIDIKITKNEVDVEVIKNEINLEIEKQGPKGGDGATGKGVPAGGDTGQILIKKTNDDFDTEWDNLPDGSKWEDDETNTIKPKDGKTVDYSHISNPPEIPSKTSQLENDSNFINEESDPDFNNWINTNPLDFNIIEITEDYIASQLVGSYLLNCSGNVLITLPAETKAVFNIRNNSGITTISNEVNGESNMFLKFEKSSIMLICINDSKYVII